MTDSIMRCLLLMSCLAFTATAQMATLSRSPRGLFGGPSKFDPRHLLKTNELGGLTKEPIKMCDERFRQTTLDHFAWDDTGGNQTYTQRYFFCDHQWSQHKGKRGPIFVYIGNEADVTLYLNATGLMWESAKEFGALLLFIEHRYYGKSLPFGEDYINHRNYLTTEQAMADYVEVLYELKEQYNARDSAVIGFGGSLGGMYCAWMRMKYPHVLDGVIAASAPIWTFMGEDPPVTPNFFARVSTFDCTPAAGSAAECVPNFKRFWSTTKKLSQTKKGQAEIMKAMKFCKNIKIRGESDALNINSWVHEAISVMSEGSYSFPSGYMIDGKGLLPAYPMRVACDYLSKPLKGRKLLEAVSQAAGVYYNYTHDLECFDYNKPVNKADEIVRENWDFQYCTEMFQVWAMDGVTDMFWADPWKPVDVMKWCKEVQGVISRPFWANQQWGGKNIETASNIVFSNGQYDPWSGGGVLEDINESVVALIVKEGGHHADLMFSNKGDSPSVRKVRNEERKWIRRWIKEKAERISRRSSAKAGVVGGQGSERNIVA